MTTVPIGRHLADLAARAPDAPALSCGPITLTRAELDRRTNRLARQLARAGVEPGTFVSIALANGTPFVETAIAAWKLGAVPQPLSHRLPAPERDAILALVQPSAVVDRPVDDDPAIPDGPVPDRVAPSWKAPTTGGSTGRPKVVVDGRPGVIDPDAPPAYRLRRDGVALFPGPLYHNAPFHGVARALLAGCHTMVAERFDAAATLDLVEQHAVDYVQLVPTMMRRIWMLPVDVRRAERLSSVAVVYHLGAPCAPWLKQAWIDWLGPERIWELYGGTERQSYTEMSGEEWLAHPGTVGRPHYGEMRVVGPDGREVPYGVTGLVQMRAPEADRPTYRYLGADSETDPDGWDSLGDVGWMDADGYVYLADRRTDLILRGGANIYPAEVEAALEAHPAVASAAVIGLPDDDLGERVHAIVQIVGMVSESALVAHVAERLARYKVPASIEFTDVPLRDDAGKVRRSALRAARVRLLEGTG